MGQRLLIVDSDRRFIQDHKAALEAIFEAEILTSTEGALSRLESGQYAAVLLCVEVAENKGYALCSAIRRSTLLKDLKVALISGKATEEEYARHQNLKGRADLYLHKPISPADLVAALTPFVPLKVVDADNPLEDGGTGMDLGEEWLASLRSELEMDAPPDPLPPAPRERPGGPPPSPGRPAVPGDAGQVELLEARIKDLETKLVAKSEEMEQRLASMEAGHERQQLELMRGIDERESQLESLSLTINTQRDRILALEQRQADLERELQAQTSRNQAIQGLLAELESKARQAMDLTKAPVN
jgi:CheY-like chemotaxis protein